MEMILLGGTLILLALSVFFTTIHPIWCIVDVVKDKKESGGYKGLWIVLTILFLGVANTIYGFVSAKSATLRKATKIGFFTGLFIVLLLSGLFVFNPSLWTKVQSSIQSKMGGQPVVVQQDKGMAQGRLAPAPQKAVAQRKKKLNNEEYVELRKSAMKALNQKKPQQAIELFRTMIAERPGDIGAQLYYGKALIDAGQKEEGYKQVETTLADLEKRSQKDPKNVNFYFLMGQAHRYQGRYQKAIDNIEKAIKMDPKRKYFQKELAEIKKEKK